MGIPLQGYIYRVECRNKKKKKKSTYFFFFDFRFLCVCVVSLWWKKASGFFFFFTALQAIAAYFYGCDLREDMGQAGRSVIWGASAVAEVGGF